MYENLFSLTDNVLLLNTLVLLIIRNVSSTEPSVKKFVISITRFITCYTLVTTGSHGCCIVKLIKVTVDEKLKATKNLYQFSLNLGTNGLSRFK